MKFLDAFLQDHTEAATGNRYVKPAMPGFDSRIRTVDATELFDGPTPSLEKIAKVAETSTGKLVCLNPEHLQIDWVRTGGDPNVYSDRPEAEKNRDTLASVAFELHRINPSLCIGYWGLMPMIFPGLLKHALRSDVKSNPRYLAMRKQNAATRRNRDEKTGRFTKRGLADYVNAIFVDGYWKSEDFDLWKAQLRILIDEALDFGKPVYVYLSMMIVRDSGITYMSAEQMRAQIDFICQFDGSIEGVAFYGRPLTDQPAWGAMMEWVEGTHAG